LAAVESILDSCGFEGAAMAEFRCDGDAAWLMEFNGRLWGSVQLAIDAGVDFPRILVDLALGRPVTPATPYRLGVRSRWFLGEVDHAIALARGGVDSLGNTGLLAALLVLAGSGAENSREEVFRWDDPSPFLSELGAWVASLFR
jgi:predicted ATP-grasp superfamily ATP-dependent carboligase